MSKPRISSEPCIMFSCRLPREMVTGLKMIARQEGVSPSDVLRDLIRADLVLHGLTPAPDKQELPGQLTIDATPHA